MPRRLRLDAELVRRGLARSREHAAELVGAGRVDIRGIRARKPASAVDPDTPLRVRPDTSGPDYVSRGGQKLAGALQAFPGLTVSGRRCLDAGASTGGFTDVLLRHGARQVVAVDVGYGQLAWRLRADERVLVHDRTNVRGLTPAQIGGSADLTVADLSFISLRLVLSALDQCTAADGDIVPMVKPQFELGRERMHGEGTAGGVVLDPALRADAVVAVVEYAAGLGRQVVGVGTSPLPGPSGNVEFFCWLRRDPPHALATDQVRRTVLEEGTLVSRDSAADGAVRASGDAVQP